MKKLIVLFFTLVAAMAVSAQRANMGKLSPWLRQIVRTEPTQLSRRQVQAQNRQAREVCAFVRVSGEADEVFRQYQCRSLGGVGTISIVSIPLDQLAPLSQDERVERIEARPVGQALTDSMAIHLNALPAYEGRNLPQAFTGAGVVVGIMDIGFDLTHPNFFSRDTTQYRIRRLWDMLSTDTLESTFYVGRDYTTPEELLALGHSRDGLEQTHGTHTLGIAAGSGYDTAYRGMAPESDLCLVANAVNESVGLIDPSLWERFTFATDALGFKYIFDYARSMGKPCVASFSEGSGQDFWGYDQLYYEMLDSLLGPGAILVAAAGNQGTVKSWFRKPVGQPSEGTFVQRWDHTMMATLKSADDFVLRIVSYGNPCDTLLLDLRQDLQRDTIFRYYVGSDTLDIEAYSSCYVSSETCFDLSFTNPKHVGYETPLSLEILGSDADVEFWRVNCTLTTNAQNPLLHAGEPHHNVHSPSSCPRVISVGATTWRDSIQNYKGQWKSYWLGERGRRVAFSSVGPTMDGRTKPDVMAPGNNIISSYSSFYLEQYPDMGDIQWDVAHFDFRGRTYAWNSNSGTSMSCPAVAGAIALWLQAKPDLSPEEALDVIAHTSRRPDPMLEYPNNEYGYGEIDVYRGLLYLLGLDGIGEISATHTKAEVSLLGGQLRVVLPQPKAAQVCVRIYDLKGCLLKTAMLSVTNGECLVDVSALPGGIYAVQIDGATIIKGSTLIRK